MGYVILEMHNILDVFEFWPDWQQTTELPALVLSKGYIQLVENYSKYFYDLLALR